MGKVAVTYRIMPEGVEIDLGAIQEKVKGMILEGSVIAKLEEKPIAFGLKFIQVVLVMDDLNNTSDQHEEAFGTIEGVQSVEVTDLNLL